MICPDLFLLTPPTIKSSSHFISLVANPAHPFVSSAPMSGGLTQLNISHHHRKADATRKHAITFTFGNLQHFTLYTLCISHIMLHTVMFYKQHTLHKTSAIKPVQCFPCHIFLSHTFKLFLLYLLIPIYFMDLNN